MSDKKRIEELENRLAKLEFKLLDAEDKSIPYDIKIKLAQKIASVTIFGPDTTYGLVEMMEGHLRDRGYFRDSSAIQTLVRISCELGMMLNVPPSETLIPLLRTFFPKRRKK